MAPSPRRPRPRRPRRRHPGRHTRLGRQQPAPARHHRLPVLRRNPRPRRQRRRRRRQVPRLERHPAELRGLAAQARRTVRRPDRQEGRRHHPGHGQAGRSRRPVQGRERRRYRRHLGPVRHQPACPLRHPGQRIQDRRRSRPLPARRHELPRQPALRPLRRQRRLAHPRPRARRRAGRKPGHQGNRQIHHGPHPKLAR